MSSNEIITLQFGNYSNHVGTHYWNFHFKRMIEHENQADETKMYVPKLFRETACSKTKFVPRMICFDIKTKLQSLKQDGTFSSVDNTNDIEMGDANDSDVNDIVTYSELSIEKNEFVKQALAGNIDSDKKVAFDFEGEVKTWTDFLMYELDSHSIQLLDETYNDGADFSYFGLGQQEFITLQDDFEDNLHFWTEECDYMEGFQLFGDIHNGYCGFQAKVLEYMADEYSKKAKLSFQNWALCKENVEDKDFIYQYLNMALSLQAMKEYSSLTVLQSLDNNLFSKQQGIVEIPNLNYKNDLVYHSSAILAAAIDCSTVPLFQINNTMNLSELCFHASLNKWKLAGTSFGVPLHESREDNTLFDMFYSSKELYGNVATSLFPNLKDTIIKPTSQLIVLQNLSADRVCPKNIDGKILQGLGLNYNVFNRNPLSVMDYFIEKYYPCHQTVTKSCYSFDKLRTGVPYPSILKNNNNDKRPTDVTTIASMFTSPSFFDMISKVVMAVKKMNLNSMHVVQEFGLDGDLTNELIEDLIQIAQTYNHDRAFHELEE